MTIIVGIICEKAIVLASDSQTTYNSSTGATQRLDTPKISTLEFSNGSALVAQSGDVTLSGRAVEILSDMAKGTPISDYRTVADLAQKAMRQVKDELRVQNLDCSAEELHGHIRRNQLEFELMIAHYHDRKPYIFTVDFAVGIASKTSHQFTAIGCGSGIATYILNWFNLGPKTYFAHAVIAALYAIEEVKKVDPYCGGKTKVGMLLENKDTAYPPGETEAEMVKMSLRCDHDEYVEAIAVVDKKAKEEWAARMNVVLAEGNNAMAEKRKQKKS